MTLNERERRDISELASAAADGRISDADRQRLEEMLLASPEARVFYTRFMHVSSGLAWSARETPAASSDRQHPRQLRDTYAGTQVHGWRSAAVAAAVLVLATFSAWAFFKPTAPATNPPGTAAGIATLSTAMNVEWTNSQEPVHVGNMLKPGWVRIKSGLAQIDFLNGASVWLEGPVEFRLDSPREGYCASGKLVAQVPRAASDFCLASPYMSIVDTGTGFGMEVNEGKRAAIHVFRGNVEVTLQESRSKTELGPGQAMAVDHAGVTSLMSADPNAFSREEFGAHWESSRPFVGPPPWSYGGSGAQFAIPRNNSAPPPVMFPGQWKGADPMEPVREQLTVDDQRWAEIRQPLEDFLSQQWKTWGFDNNPDEKGVSRARYDLQFAIEAPDATDAELAKRLQAYRTAKANARKFLEEKELQLRSLLTDQEQARLVNLGYIP